MLHWIRSFISMTQRVIVQFIEDGCAMRAAALAFTSLLALVPLMTVSFSVMSAFPMFKGLGGEIQDFVFKNFVATSANVIQRYLQQFAQQALNLSTTGLIFLLITAILMIFNMEAAFNAIWRVERSRRGITAFLMYWAVLTLLPILMGIGFAITSYLFSLPFVAGTTEVLGLRTPLLTLFPYTLTLIAFTLLYIALPNCKVFIRHAVAGGIVATLLFELAKLAFGLYIVHFPTYELLYGALSAIPIFLMWVYVSWLIVLFGAVVCYVLGTRSKSSPPVMDSI